MNWPRGKYNGKRIGGFRIDFEFNLYRWAWGFNRNPFYRNFHIGPLHWWFEMVYEK